MIKSSVVFTELFTKIPAENIISRDFLLLRFRAAENISTSHQLGIVVGKRNFKKAVDRNLLKRRIREAIRLNFHLLQDQLPLEFVIVYNSKQIKDFNQINQTISKLFSALVKRLNTNL